MIFFKCPISWPCFSRACPMFRPPLFLILVRANPHKIFSLAPKGQATGTACSSLKFHFCLLGIPKTFCVVALEMKNKNAARNRAHLHIMFMMRAKIENPWHKNLADCTDGPTFFRPLKAKFADAKQVKMVI